MTAGADLAAAGEGLVGVPFRFHGRDPTHGLDCVGVIAEALRRCGRVPVMPHGYGLRLLDIAPLFRFATASGLRDATDAIAPGDVLLAHLHGLQPHLLLAASGGALIHAHAGIGKVIRQAGPMPWPVAGHWRLDTKG